ncbi:MAG: SRPBCC domain-containing protein [Pseudomonadota bacterium]
MTDQNWVQITRDFDAPIQDIWNMWTDPELFSRWYGPNGFTVPVAEMDVTVGGTRKICMEMKAPERTMTMWFIGTYTVVSAPHRLVYTESMCDADGNVLSPSDMGMPPGTPDVTEVSIELSEADGKTRMVMTHKGVPAGSPGEGGWMQAFDKLAAQL